MSSFEMRLSCLNDVGTFVRVADTIPCEITVKRGSFSVNGKSLMGILSLDLSAPLLVEVDGTPEEADHLKTALQDFLI